MKVFKTSNMYHVFEGTVIGKKNPKALCGTVGIDKIGTITNLDQLPEGTKICKHCMKYL